MRQDGRNYARLKALTYHRGGLRTTIALVVAALGRSVSSLLLRVAAAAAVLVVVASVLTHVDGGSFVADDRIGRVVFERACVLNVSVRGCLRLSELLACVVMLVARSVGVEQLKDVCDGL